MDSSRLSKLKSAGMKDYSRRVIQATPELAPGEVHPNVPEVQNYLKHYGYLDPDVPPSDELDAPTTEALAEFQRRFDIGAPGTFDDATREVMSFSRCGIPDAGPLDFAAIGPFDRRELRFAYGPLSAQIADGTVRDCVRRAFDTWSLAGASLTFIEVAVNDNPDIVIEWRRADDPDHSMVGGVLAHADFPPGFSIIVTGLPLPLHFDDQEHRWVDGTVPGGFDIETVALHEIGHCLGLLHSNVPGSVMFPFISSQDELRSLQPDDLAGIRSLYP
jgi:hypothetical protein